MKIKSTVLFLLLVSPIMGEQMNVSYEMKLGFTSPHEVSAYAVVKAAFDKDIIKWR